MFCEFIISSLPNNCLAFSWKAVKYSGTLGGCSCTLRVMLLPEPREEYSLGRTVVTNEEGFVSSSATNPKLLWAGLHLLVPGQVRQLLINEYREL